MNRFVSRSTRTNRPMLVVVGLLATACGDPSADDGDDLPMADAIDPVPGECDDESAGPIDPYADCVERFTPADAVSFGHDAMPGVVLGAPQGGGEAMGGTDVVSLGCGGSITLHFSEPWPTDGPGPDFAVFENAFVAGSTTFVEPAQVQVSPDGTNWYDFGCDPLDPELVGCAGVHPVLDAPDDDPEAAGGDRFDLEDVGLPYARYVRLIDRTLEYYGEDLWCMGAAGGFDLDAVAVLEAM